MESKNSRVIFFKMLQQEEKGSQKKLLELEGLDS